MSSLLSALHHSITHITRSPAVYYTERQLYYEVCRTLRPKWGVSPQDAPFLLPLGWLVALILVRHSWRTGWRLALNYTAVIGLLAAVAKLPYTCRPPLSYGAFTEILEHYCLTYGRPAYLLPPDLVYTHTATIAAEPDLLDYGVPRVLICQQQAVATMLLANEFHIELACPILTWAEAIPAAIHRMIQRSQAVEIYLLHDASPDGLALASDARRNLGIDTMAHVALLPLGLRPTQAQQLNLFAQQMTSPPAQAIPYPLTPAERQWLTAGWVAEVEAIPPERLLRALRWNLLGAVRPRWRLPRIKDVGFMTWPER